MKDNSRTLASGHSYFGRALVVAQVALSVVLLIGAGLFVRTLSNLRGVVGGLNPETVLQFDLNPGLSKADPSRAVPLFEEMIQQIDSVPGVRSATVFSCGFNFLGFTDINSGRRFQARYLRVRENFFDTMGIPLLIGRAFGPADNQGAREVLIVNEAFVHKYFVDVSPLGKTANGEIIGVVRDSKIGWPQLRENVAPTIYRPYRQGGAGCMTFGVGTHVNAASVFPLVRMAIQKVDTHLPLSNVRTLTEEIDKITANEKMFAGLSTLFAALALILTCVGFYGVMAYGVARRTNEIGIRMALGAKPLDVVRLVMGEGLLLVFIGATAGVCVAVASTRFVESIVFGLAPDDGLTIILAVLLMSAVAALAAFIPARKASHIDPLVAVRYE